MTIMTFTPDSPELTAYLLGELDSDTRTALERALVQSPELRTELESLQATLGVVSEAFSVEPEVHLSPIQQQRVLAAMASHAAVPEPAAEGTRRRPQQSSNAGESAAGWAWLAGWLGWRGGAVLAGAMALLATALLVTLPPARRVSDLSSVEQLRYQPDRKLGEFAMAPESAAGSAPVTPSANPEVSERAKEVTKVAEVTAPASAAANPRFSVEPTLAKRYGLAQEATRGLSHLDDTVKPLATATLATPPPGAEAEGLRTRGGVDRLDTAVAPTRGLTDLSLVPQGEAARSKAKWAYAGVGGTSEAQTQGGRRFVTTASPRWDELRDSNDLYKRTSPSDAKEKVRLLARNPAGGAPEVYYEYRGVAGVGEAEQQWSLALGDDAGRRPALVEQLGESRTPATSFASIHDNPFQTALAAPLSTFGMDVDTASYSLVRRMLREQSLPPGDSVRLEELLNYFSYEYPQPTGDHPLGAAVEMATCPWNDAHKLVRIGVKARDLAGKERPRSNLVFLLDVSGSMAPENRLPLVKRAMRLLLDRLSAQDTVGIVTYAGEARVALDSVGLSGEGRRQVTEVLESLQAGSGTHGSAGIQNAYAMATNHFIPGGVNRVILCTDGDFNVGVTDREQLLDLITTRAKSGVFLSVLGFGMDNLKDATLELLADRGNGNYAYIDSFSEARKVLVKQLDGTLVTVAKDAKIQVEFNPARVARYRLLGYEKRLLRDRDFNDDTKDAGEVGAGHSVTVLYEIEPVAGTGAGVDPLRYHPQPATGVDSKIRGAHSEELMNLKIRYKQPDGQTSRLLEFPVKDADRDLAQASADFKFAASVAGYGMLLRQSPHAGTLTWEKVLRLAEQGQGTDPDGYRAEFIDLARRAQALRHQP